MKNTKTSFFIMLTAALLALTLSACSRSDQPKQHPQKTVVTKLSSTHQTLYFSGTIAPIKTTPLPSPIAGTVVNTDFHYGETVRPGQTLLTIRSDKLEQNYRQALTNYLKAKNSYSDAKAQFENAQGLWQEGIISRDDFDAKKDTLETSSLGFISAQYQLEHTLKQLKAKIKSVEALSLENETEIKAILAKQYDELAISAPTAGVVLLAKISQAAGGSPQKIMVGASVKAGQNLLSIGDLTGISTIAAVNQLDINKIKPGQLAEITSSAFPGLILKGTVTTVGIQAKSNNNGGMVTFPATVVVKQLSLDAQQLIRMGMEVKIAIHLSAAAHIIVPVNAIQQQNGNTVVTVIDAAGAEKVIPVKTGPTTLTGVTILSGLKPGMKVLLHNPN